MADCKKLRDPHLNVAPPVSRGEGAKLLDIVGNEESVTRLDGLRRFLDELATCKRLRRPPGLRRTLDLIAHSDQWRLLHLGESVIDPNEDGVRQFFEEMATEEILKRLDVSELRLLGCETAMSPQGQEAIRLLTDILGVPVLGTTKLVYAAHFDEKGFKDRYERLLCDASNLPELDAERIQWPKDPLPALAPPFEPESLETLPAGALPKVSWPRIGERAETPPNSQNRRDVQALTDILAGSEGRVMPRMLARPRCELLLGSGDDKVSRVQVLFDHELVRVRAADTKIAAIYRVRRPDELAAWIASIDVPASASAGSPARRASRSRVTRRRRRSSRPSDESGERAR